MEIERIYIENMVGKSKDESFYISLLREDIAKARHDFEATCGRLFISDQIL